MSGEPDDDYGPIPPLGLFPEWDLATGRIAA